MNYKSITKLREKLDTLTMNLDVGKKTRIRFCPYEEAIVLSDENYNERYLSIEEAQILQKFLNRMLKT